MALTMTACGASEPASAPSVAETDKAAVQEKLNKQDGKTDETKADDKQSDNSAVTTQAETEAPTDSDGKNILAIGNPLGFDLMNTVTGGIVSGLNRCITINEKSMTLIQTDAAINSGNSGGPLINKKGQVIGINSSKMSASYSEASIEGIGFAIPSNEAARIVKDIMEYGYVTGKPQLGISCQDVTENISRMYNIPVGVYITEVAEDSAAEKAGLQSGDIITKINDEDVASYDELTAKKNEHKAGETIELTYVRNGEENKVTVILDEAVAAQN